MDDKIKITLQDVERMIDSHWQEMTRKYHFDPPEAEESIKGVYVQGYLDGYSDLLRISKTLDDIEDIKL